MSTDDGMRLLYLVLLLAFLVFSGIGLRRFKFGQLMRTAVIWVFAFGLLAGIYGLWETRLDPIPQAVVSSGKVDIPRHSDGHFYLTAQVDGQPVRFLIDTGATEIILTQQDAERVGINLSTLTFLGRAQTANGEVAIAPVTLADVSVGNIRNTNLRAWVNRGDMSQSLLGMSYLNTWDKIEISKDSITLTR